MGWYGKWKGHVDANGVPNGFGMFHGREKYMVLCYEGEMKQGKFHGYGRIIYTNGSSYEGFFDKGSFSGAGTRKIDGSENKQVNWLHGNVMTNKEKPIVDKETF